MTEMIRGGARVVDVGSALVEGLEVTADTGGRTVVVVVVGVVVLVVIVVVILICI